MKIIEGDLVDWEPLLMRFQSSLAITADRRTALGDFLENWFQSNSNAQRADCDIRYWNVDPANMSAACEHLTLAALRRLTKALVRRFPEIESVRLGIEFDGVPSGLDFKWIALTNPMVDMDGTSREVEPFAVSQLQVSMGQFTEFMSASGYIPDCDKVEYDGYLETHMKLNWGKSPKTPVFGVTFNDAKAFADWANLRLPTEIELHAFFVHQATSGVETRWQGECWTTTLTDTGNHILRDGPYAPTLHLSIDRFRADFPAEHYDYPFPVFRVAKSLKSDHNGPDAEPPTAL
jgi:hypothetical protein